MSEADGGAVPLMIKGSGAAAGPPDTSVQWTAKIRAVDFGN